MHTKHSLYPIYSLYWMQFAYNTFIPSQYSACITTNPKSPALPSKSYLISHSRVHLPLMNFTSAVTNHCHDQDLPLASLTHRNKACDLWHKRKAPHKNWCHDNTHDPTPLSSHGSPVLPPAHWYAPCRTWAGLHTCQQCFWTEHSPNPGDRHCPRRPTTWGGSQGPSPPICRNRWNQSRGSPGMKGAEWLVLHTW